MGRLTILYRTWAKEKPGPARVGVTYMEGMPSGRSPEGNASHGAHIVGSGGPSTSLTGHAVQAGQILSTNDKQVEGHASPPVGGPHYFEVVGTTTGVTGSSPGSEIEVKHEADVGKL